MQNFALAKSCRCKLELLFSPPVPHTATPSIQLHVQSTTDSEYDANSIVPQGGEAEDEYTLSGYGDISLSEVIVPPLPSPPRRSPGLLQPRIPQPRLRLKVRRPPMPKRRLSYTYIPDPLPHSGGMESDEYWPGSPRPITNVSLFHIAPSVAHDYFEYRLRVRRGFSINHWYPLFLLILRALGRTEKSQ